MLPLAFSPFELWPFAALSPALLFVACRCGSAWRAFVRGAAFGLSSFGIGVSWIHHSFQFSNIGLALASVLTAGFVLFLALFPALACALFARLTPEPARGAAAAALVFAALYVLAEWLRGWLLTGFTWLQLGYAQVDGPLASALALLGSYGMGLLTAVLGVVLAALWLGGVVRASIASVLVALFVYGAAALLPEAWTRAGGEPLRVAIVQGNIAQDRKWLPQMREPTLERYLGLTERHRDADLVVWPETAVPGLRHRMQPFLEQVHARALAAGNAVLVGLPELDQRTGAAYNSVELLGRGRGLYRKRHLVPFGEYLPLEPLLRPIVRVLAIPVSNFSAGSPSQPPLELGEHRVAVYICYEIAFGGEVARTLSGAQLIVTVSNDAWFGDSLGPVQHLQMARARALESGRYLVRATNTGISAVVDPRGRVRLELPRFEAADGAAEVELRYGTTPYLRYGDWPAVVAAFALLVLGIGGARRAQAPAHSDEDARSA